MTPNDLDLDLDLPTATPTVDLPRLALCVSDLEAVRGAWERERQGDPHTPAVRLPKTPPTVGQRFLVAEPFRLLIRSYSSAVVYGDGRASAGYMDLPIEERDTAALLDTRHIMAAEETFGAEYSSKVLSAGGRTSSIRFHPAKKMPTWAARWEIEVVALQRLSMRVRVHARHRTTARPMEWNVAEARRISRLWAALNTAHKLHSIHGQAQRFATIAWGVFCAPNTGKTRYAPGGADLAVLHQYMHHVSPAVRHLIADRMVADLPKRIVRRRHQRTQARITTFIESLRWDVVQPAPDVREGLNLHTAPALTAADAP